MFVPLLVVLIIGGVHCELSEFTASSTQFTFNFFKRAFNPSENAILSPISMQSALGMFYPLAGSQVSPDMQKSLHLPADKTSAVEGLSRFLISTNKQSDALKVLSKVYHVDAPLNPAVLPLFRGRFGAEVESANFQDVDAVVRSVNNWAEKATDGMIKEYMETGDVRVDNDLMLLNVVALNASWKVPFDPADTTETEFRFVNGKQKIQMMHVSGKFPFGVLDQLNCYAVELDYQDNADLSMVVLLPKTKFTLQNVVEALSVDAYQSLDSNLHTATIDVSIPKFTMRKKTDAKELLKEMGLKSMFEKHDFDLLTRDKSRIGEVRQTGFIRVDEHGTEAAAVTDVQAVGRSGHVSFYANRPFLYLIRKRSTKDIIFIGHYSAYEQQ